jgi:hypothetical protein
MNGAILIAVFRRLPAVAPRPVGDRRARARPFEFQFRRLARSATTYAVREPGTPFRT